MKVLFLDFDGVLNDTTFIDLTEDLFSAQQIDPRAVALLNEIVRATGAKVVVTSSWRRVHRDLVLSEILRSRGFEGELLGSTPSFQISPDGIPKVRGDEIQAWLDASSEPVETFAVLDDDADMVHLEHHLARTDATRGLQAEQVAAAVRHLNDA